MDAVGSPSSQNNVKVISVTASDAKTGESITFSYVERCKAGAGSFGVVTEAVDYVLNRRVAIKKVLQDRRYKVRALTSFQF